MRSRILSSPGDASLANAKSILGECLTVQKHFEEAAPLLLTSYDELKAKLGDQDKRTTSARERLKKLYDDWNKPEEAAKFR